MYSTGATAAGGEGGREWQGGEDVGGLGVPLREGGETVQGCFTKLLAVIHEMANHMQSVLWLQKSLRAVMARNSGHFSASDQNHHHLDDTDVTTCQQQWASTELSYSVP